MVQKMSSFGVSTNAANAKNVITQVVGTGDTSPMKSTTCYTPTGASDTVSLLKTPGLPRCTLATKAQSQLAVIPGNAIIDMVEYFGFGGLLTKGHFHIGLGQLNGGMLFPLIESGSSTIANEKVGGCRQFVTAAANGANEKNILLYPSYVNVTFEHPVSNGGLQVVVYYHLKTEAK